MFEVRKYEFILELQTPLSHAEGTFGNTSLAMREKFRMKDGTFTRIPIITGDAIRNRLRYAVAMAYLDAAGVLEKPELSEEALRLLFAGGMITGSESGSVRIDEFRRVCNLFPPLALLGGCTANRAVPGRLVVDPARLICSETAYQTPPKVLAWMEENGYGLSESRAHIDEVTRVRMDPMLNPSNRLLLKDGGARAERALEAHERAKEEGALAVVERNKSTMMPRTSEQIVTGSLFYWAVEARCYSPLDVDTFHTMIGAFLADARVGGKQAVGCGRIRPLVGFDITVNRPRDSVGTAIELANLPRVGTLFREHVAKNAEAAREWLKTVDS